jgi:uncharacterized protein (TIGR03067 family)
MRSPLVVAAAGLMTVIAFSPPGARADDRDELQGTWKAVYAAAAGNVAPPAVVKQVSVTFSGDEFTLKEPGGSETITFTLHPGARPHKAIDFGVRSGVNPGKGKGRGKARDVTLYLGIYKFEAPNRLKLSWGPAGAGRPAHFNARQVKGHKYLILEKQ